MADSALDERSIFLQAVELSSADDRASFLDEVCGGNRRLRSEVEALLQAHGGSCGWLDAPDHNPNPFDQPPIIEQPGSTIGPYKLLEQIGEGGMGTVFMAEQSNPVRRKVALKIIKPGMDTKQVIARFEAERQALALMDHPNIAKVHDGGTTEAGRPYFVMELVRGMPITDYCDREQLSIPDRLDLFVLVCRAVQHAHQKGIIHRDLKPSNILVTVIDGVAVPKVIDFGVAKATGASLTDRTMYTAFHQFVGTPLYMSPEQADLAGVDVDTRSDIYALGVLLYELLTGTTPFDQETFRKAAFDEVRRIVREVEPPRPSTRLSTLGESLSTVSTKRNAAPERLSHAVRGELDWIVMKALEKDRNRRYETANGFAADVMRYLTDQPVEACPPSARYRFQKFARRNRASLTTTALVALALVTGTAISTWQAIQATHAKAEAAARAEESRLVLDYLVKDVFGGALPEKTGSRTLTAPELVTRGEKAIAARFAGRPLVEATAREAMGDAYRFLGRFADAQKQLCLAAEIRTRVLGPDHPATLSAQALLVLAMGSEMYGHFVQKPEAETLARHVLEARRRVLGPAHPDTLMSMNHLVGILRVVGKLDEALPLAKQAVPLHVRVLGPDHPETLTALASLGGALIDANRMAEAESVLRQQLEGRLRVGGPNDAFTHYARQHLAYALFPQGKVDEALSLMYENIEGLNSIWGASHPTTFGSLLGTEVILQAKGDQIELRDFYQRWLRRILAVPADPDADLVDKRELRLVSFAQPSDPVSFRSRRWRPGRECGRGSRGTLQWKKRPDHARTGLRPRGPMRAGEAGPSDGDGTDGPEGRRELCLPRRGADPRSLRRIRSGPRLVRQSRSRNDRGTTPEQSGRRTPPRRSGRPVRRDSFPGAKTSSGALAKRSFPLNRIGPTETLPV